MTTYCAIIRSRPRRREARRALKILLTRLPAARRSAPAPCRPRWSSARSRIRCARPRRMRLTTWEKLDFGVTSFLYGLSVGVSYGLSVDDGDERGRGHRGHGPRRGHLHPGLGRYLSLANPSRGRSAAGAGDRLLPSDHHPAGGEPRPSTARMTSRSRWPPPATGLLAVPLAVPPPTAGPGSRRHPTGARRRILGAGARHRRHARIRRETPKLSETSRATGNQQPNDGRGRAGRPVRRPGLRRPGRQPERGVARTGAGRHLGRLRRRTGGRPAHGRRQRRRRRCRCDLSRSRRREACWA